MSSVAVQVRDGPDNLRGRWEPQGYGCMDRENSLFPVPPGETRQSMGYCAACPFEWNCPGCVFFPGYSPVPQPRRRKDSDFSTEAKRERYRREAARKRAQGLASNGRPLKRSCWNCDQLCRADGTGYVCGLEPMERPISAASMRSRWQRAQRCEHFNMRLVVDIPELEGENG